MPSKHCSPQEPPLAMWSSVGSAQAAGSSHQGTSAASRGAVQAGGCGQRGSRKFHLCLPCLLVVMPCSISKRAWVLRVCLSSDRRQPPRESRPSFPGPTPGSHTPPNAACWEQQMIRKRAGSIRRIGRRSCHWPLPSTKGLIWTLPNVKDQGLAIPIR